MANDTILDLDAMMDSALDAIPEAPDYITPPAGNYMLEVNNVENDKYKDKEQVEKTRIKITYKILSTIDLSDTTQLPVSDGTLFTETFMATEQGVGFFKKQAKNVLNVSTVDGTPLRDIYNTLKGVQFKAAITIRKTPGTGKNLGKEFENATIRPVHEVASA